MYPHLKEVIAAIGDKPKKQIVGFNPTELTKEREVMKKVLIIAMLIAGVTAVALTSCNVTRTITTQSQYWQKGDTSVVIQTKTIETYDASRKL